MRLQRTTAVFSIGLLILPILSLIVSDFPIAHAQQAEVDRLKSQIDERNSRLQDIEAEIAKYKSQLQEVGAEKNTLQKAINQLELERKKVQADIAYTQNRIGATDLEISKLEKGLPVLASVAGGAPMLGFLGTVMGMIQAFYDMSNAGNNIDVTLLSTGIYQAMVTTVAGLIVGIIAYFAYNILVSNVEKVVFKMEATTSDFMDLLNEPA